MRSTKQFYKALKRCYDGYRIMCEEHPKAAKKERVRKKWLKKYGPGMSSLIRYENPFLSLIEKHEEFSGRTAT